jgi:hypothetical protein
VAERADEPCAEPSSVARQVVTPGDPLDVTQAGADDRDVLDREPLVGKPVDGALGRRVAGTVLTVRRIVVSSVGSEMLMSRPWS